MESRSQPYRKRRLTLQVGYNLHFFKNSSAIRRVEEAKKMKLTGSVTVIIKLYEVMRL